mgnify:CR=1 FL=1
MLTEREKWLVEKAYEAGADSVLDAACELFEAHKYRFKPCQHWLEDIVADGGVTVELALCKDAPNYSLSEPCKDHPTSNK